MDTGGKSVAGPGSAPNAAKLEDFTDPMHSGVQTIKLPLPPSRAAHEAAMALLQQQAKAAPTAASGQQPEDGATSAGGIDTAAAANGCRPSLKRPLAEDCQAAEDVSGHASSAAEALAYGLLPMQRSRGPPQLAGNMRAALAAGPGPGMAGPPAGRGGGRGRRASVLAEAEPGSDGGDGEMEEAAAPVVMPEPVEVTVAIRVSGSRATDEPRYGNGTYTKGPACGIFDPKLYMSRMDCIYCEGAVVSRSHFEKMGGSNMAKWYRSIRVIPTMEPLGEWLERHGLPVLKGAARRSRPRKHVGNPASGGLTATNNNAVVELSPVGSGGEASGGGGGGDGVSGGGGGGGEVNEPPAKRHAGSGEGCSSSCAEGDDWIRPPQHPAQQQQQAAAYTAAAGGAVSSQRLSEQQQQAAAARAAAQAALARPGAASGGSGSRLRHSALARQKDGLKAEEDPNASGGGVMPCEPNDDEAEGTEALMSLSMMPGGGDPVEGGGAARPGPLRGNINGAEDGEEGDVGRGGGEGEGGRPRARPSPRQQVQHVYRSRQHSQQPLDVDHGGGVKLEEELEGTGAVGTGGYARGTYETNSARTLAAAAPLGKDVDLAAEGGGPRALAAGQDAAAAAADDRLAVARRVLARRREAEAAAAAAAAGAASWMGTAGARPAGDAEAERYDVQDLAGDGRGSGRALPDGRYTRAGSGLGTGTAGEDGERREALIAAARARLAAYFEPPGGRALGGGRNGAAAAAGWHPSLAEGDAEYDARAVVDEELDDGIDDSQLHLQLATVGAPALLISIQLERLQLLQRVRQLDRLKDRVLALQQHQARPGRGGGGGGRSTAAAADPRAGLHARLAREDEGYGAEDGGGGYGAARLYAGYGGGRGRYSAQTAQEALEMELAGYARERELVGGGLVSPGRAGRRSRPVHGALRGGVFPGGDREAPQAAMEEDVQGDEGWVDAGVRGPWPPRRPVVMAAGLPRGPLRGAAEAPGYGGLRAGRGAPVMEYDPYRSYGYVPGQGGLPAGRGEGEWE